MQVIYINTIKIFAYEDRTGFEGIKIIIPDYTEDMVLNVFPKGPPITEIDLSLDSSKVLVG